MRRLAFWLSLLIPALMVVCGVSCGSFPLGVPGEWAWDRVASTEAPWLTFGPLLVAAALYLGFVSLGARRIERSRLWELSGWISGLVVGGFAWLWLAQEAAPDNYQLSKAAWILYSRGSSGYFSEANEAAGDLAAYLAAYEHKMAQGDVLHIGTHPPGLTVALRLLLGACREYPMLAEFAAATQPESVRAAFTALDSTSSRPQPLSKVEQGVLWLAALLVQAGAVLAIVPLFGLLRALCSRRASWLAVAFWPSLPALAIFLPKADCLYPLLATTFLWLWLTALARRSGLRYALAGLVLWVGLLLSLAFLPIALIAVVAGCWALAGDQSQQVEICAYRPALRSMLPACSAFGRGLTECCRKLAPAAGWGAFAFAVPCLATWWFLKLNLLTVWWLNFKNHAGFYTQYPRTYWKWLLVNPVELTVAAGAPLSVLAIWSIAGTWRKGDGRPVGHISGWLLTIGLLWLSGKNMGEAARLWIVLMPCLVWFAGPLFEVDRPLKNPIAAFARDARPGATFPAGELCIPGPGSFFADYGWSIALAVQLVTTTAIVTQVAGFHYPITTT